MGDFAVIRFHPDGELSPPAGGDSGYQLGRIKFRPEEQTAPSIPISSSGTSGAQDSAQTLVSLSSKSLALWSFDLTHEDAPGVFHDYAPRWILHPAVLSDPSSDVSVGVNGSLFNGNHDGTNPQSPQITLQGGSGLDQVFNTSTTPVFSCVVVWGTDPVPPAPAHSTALTQPADSDGSVLPLWGFNSFSGITVAEGITLGYQWHTTWTGIPGSWDAVYTCKAVVSVPTGSGTRNSYYYPGIPRTLGIEFDRSANTITLGWIVKGVADTSGPYAVPASYIPTTLFTPSTLGSTAYGSGIFTSFGHPHATLQVASVFSGTAAETLTAIVGRIIVNGGGGRRTDGVHFKSSFRETGNQPIPSRLTEYSHYWPLNDPSPGPMIDIANGSRLSVHNPSLAVFQTDGVNPLEPDGAPVPNRCIEFTRSGSTYSYLIGDGTAAISPGGSGHDFTFAVWLAWNGPPLPVDVSGSYTILNSNSLPAISAGTSALSIYIGWGSVAEPFGVGWDSWSTTTSRYEQLRTSDFDWPYKFAQGGNQKTPAWTQAVFVYRTTGPTTVQKEIWIDGIEVASASADANGWGDSVWIVNVGGFQHGTGPGSEGTTWGRFQDLTFFPFALSADEIAASLTHVT